jgi:SAM-dependent methyltransferase
MDQYCGQDFRRFVYTYGLARDLTGAALELGANPYFTTMLLTQFSPLQLTLANFFGPQVKAKAGGQEVLFQDFRTKQSTSTNLSFHHFNVEQERFPFADGEFHVVFFCEILEHLLNDPLAALLEIKRVLKPEGALVLTTPNVSRLENRARLLAGVNIYDPYSGYGPYGRHNREYNKSELQNLLGHAGFSIETLFSADVHDNTTNYYVPLSTLAPLIAKDDGDLGQYLFVRARNNLPAKNTKPSWLYRAYPGDQLES